MNQDKPKQRRTFKSPTFIPILTSFKQKNNQEGKIPGRFRLNKTKISLFITKFNLEKEEKEASCTAKDNGKEQKCGIKIFSTLFFI